MIKIKYLNNNNFLVRYNGDRSDFDAYINIVINNYIYCAKPNIYGEGGWIFNYNKLEDIKKSFNTIIYENEYSPPPYIHMGKDMKLQPYEYQKEAIYFAINNLNSLMVLPCGSGS